MNRLTRRATSFAACLTAFTLSAGIAHAADGGQGVTAQASSQDPGAQGGLFLPPEGEMQVVNPQAAYAPGEAVEFIVSGCSPYGLTRLELRNDLVSGAVAALYPSPTVNVGGYVRAAVQLPSAITSGVRYLLLSCTATSGAPITAAAQFTVVAGTWFQPAWPVPVTAVPSSQPQAATTTVPLAYTGFETPTFLGASIVLALAGLGLIVLSRRRAATQWSRAALRAGVRR